MSPAPHIYTLTGNLLAERTLEFTSWAPGKTQRAIRESFQVGGKGINVSKMLNRLGAPNTALCFAGGSSGAECEAWLRERGFAHRVFATDRATRTGTVVRAPNTPETTFLGSDVVPTASAIVACAQFLDAQPDGHILAICGSVPGWAGSEFAPLRHAIERWATRGVVAADTYGPPLEWLSTQPLALVKINAAEFAAFGAGAADPAAGLAQALARFPVRSWIISDGPKPVWFASKSLAPTSVTPPLVREVSATGSGDVLFACVLDALFCRGTDLSTAVVAALPRAAANAAHPGIAEFP
ncbi:MAG TPA: PfkB family carbohydrate kinase [Opitutus sp.]|nr:PfkB family carbohydrate kinase [Opitutus sp.]